jgi:ubiquinone biosynthesis accessory factor UbiJ
MLTSTIENLLNRNLPRSPRARALCTSLAGRKIAVEVRGLSGFAIRSDGKRLEVAAGAPGDAEVRLTAGPISLLACAGRKADRAWGPGVDVSGNTEIAAAFLELLRLLEPDFEEELALAVGDVPAHEIARLTRTMLGWWRRAADTTLRNVAEYLAHERGDLVSRSEGRELRTGIDSVRDTIERLEARIDALDRRGAAARPEQREA